MKIDTSASLTHSLTNNVDKKELSVLKKKIKINSRARSFEFK